MLNQLTTSHTPPDDVDCSPAVHHISGAIQGVILVFAFGLLVFLATYHLTWFPKTWFDEGMNLVVAKNVAEFGRYVQSPASPVVFDATISTGPTVILPISFVFTLFGAGLLQARAVMVAYLIATTLGIYTVARQFFGATVAAITVILLSAVGPAGLFVNGRDVLGEVPALGFLYWGVGLLIWSRTRSKSAFAGIVSCLCVGLLFGLAVLTKNQFALLIPDIVLVWIASRVLEEHMESLPIGQALIILAGAALPLVCWFSYQFAVLGPSGFWTQVHRMGVVGAPSYVAPFERAATGVAFLYSSGFVLVGAPGLLYVGMLLFRYPLIRKFELTFLLGFAVTWLLWFLTSSIGWPRYAIPVAITSVPFTAKLICDLAREQTPLKRLTGQRGLALSDFRLDPPGTALLFILFGLLTTGVVSNIVEVNRARDTTVQRFASVVEENARTGDVVESFEWEITFLINQKYHYPADRWMVASIESTFLSKNELSPGSYSIPSNVTLLVNGPFSKSIGLYQSAIDHGDFRHVATVGNYDLYRRGSHNP